MPFTLWVERVRFPLGDIADNTRSRTAVPIRPISLSGLFPTRTPVPREIPLGIAQDFPNRGPIGCPKMGKERALIASGQHFPEPPVVRSRTTAGNASNASE